MSTKPTTDLGHWRDYVDDAGGPFRKDGLRYNNMFKKGSKAGMDIYWDFYIKNGRGPNSKEYIDAGGKDYASWNNINKDFKDVIIPAVESSGMLPNTGGPETLMDQVTQGGKIHTDLYDMLKKGGEIQHQEGMKNLAQSERDLNMNQAMDRKKFIEDIRNRRRTALKTGLSSSQIANEEVQSLLMAQNQSNQNAMGFFNQRSQLQSQFAMNDVNANMGAYEMLGSGYGSNLSAIQAGMAGDANQSALGYLQNRTTPGFGDAYTKVTKPE